MMWFTWLCTDICMGHCIVDLAGLFLGWLIPGFEESGLLWDYNYWFGGQVIQEGIVGFLIVAYLNDDMFWKINHSPM